MQPVVRCNLKLGSSEESLFGNALPQAQEQNHFKNGRLCARECDYVANGYLALNSDEAESSRQFCSRKGRRRAIVDVQLTTRRGGG